MGVFNSGGPSPGGPTGLILGPDGNSDGNDDLYVSCQNNDMVICYSGTTGAYITQFVTSGSGGLDAPWGLVLKTVDLLYNDDCNQPMVISATPGQPFHLNGLDVSGATTSVDDPCLSCGDSEFPQQSHSVWFTYTPPTNEWIYTLSTSGSNYDTVLAVFTGDCNGDLTEVACDDNGAGLQSSIHDLFVEGGVPLLIEVTSYGQEDANSLSLTLQHPFVPVHNITNNTYHNTIQSAINVAGFYDEIVALQRKTYHEHLVIPGSKNIILRSSNPNDPSVVAGTIIDGDLDSNSTTPEGPVIVLAGFLEDCVIAGFTITGGGTDEYGGGILGSGSFATIRDCIITDNWAGEGGGIAACNGTIERCVISNNTSYIGGGIAYCDGRIERCIISRNTSRIGGGGLVDCDGYITNCTIANNSAEYFSFGRGGGLWMCDGVLNGCTIIGNTAFQFGGIAQSNCSLTNCTVAWNSSAVPYPSIILGSGDIRNSIIWGNNPINLVASTASYSLIQGGWPGEGNIDLDPLLTPDGHLRSGSPCINLGDPAFAIDPNYPNDIDAENRVMFGRIDIGSDEFLDTDGDGQPDWWERKYFGDPNAANPNEDRDGDQLKNLDEFELYSSNPYGQLYFVSDTFGNNSYNGHAPSPQGGDVGPKKTIQGGLDEAGDGDTVLVLPGGTYSGAGNYELDYGGKSLIVRREGNPASLVTIDCGSAGRAINHESITGIFAALEGFMIDHSSAYIGGGIRTENSRFMFKDCVVTGSTATYKAGGIYSNLSSPTFSNLVIQDSAAPNEPNVGLIKYSNINLQGDLSLEAGKLDVIASRFYGPGRINLKEGTLLTVTGSMVISTDVNGPGDIYVDAGAELIIEGDAIVNLAHETDPNLNGTILCDGLLLVRDSVHLSNANIQVTRASFEGDVDISNSIITAEAGSPYGQFFIEDTVSIVGNDIHADGDRYMDLDPSVFAGVIASNRIYVTITEGVGNTRGGLLELRGEDGLAVPPCGPNEFFCQVNDVPIFDTNSWMIEQLEVVEGAKVNLTNRFDFGNGGLYEVMYVKNLILGPNSLLNTAFNQLYYENLVGDLNSVRNQPLLGFSLSNIALDNHNEFLTRVMHNNYTHPENPAYDRTHVKRIDGNEPDPNGMMRMCNLQELDPCSPNYGQVINARAKGLFAKASEDEILILFEYLFGTSDPNVELVIYLSDVPELLDHNDPCRAEHYIEVARLYPPPAGQYGSVGSDRFGVFEKIVSTGDLNFIRGVRMELELAGPDGTCILINNWDPYISCVYCGDVTGDFGVTPRDYLTVLGESGELSSGLSGLGLSLYCLDFGFSLDGFLDTTDLLGWDWGDWLVSEGHVGHLCLDLFLTPFDSSESSDSSAFIFETASGAPPGAGGAADFTGSLLIAGKRFDAGQQDFLSDRLYDFNESYNLVGGPYALSNDRMNGKLVRDHNDLLYQINVEEGLVRFSDLNSVIPRGQGCSIGSEPRYSQPAAVYVGFQDQGENTWGRPFFDAAFDSQGYVYVTPVVVVPDVCDPYVAAAKLALAPGQTPPYSIVEIYDVPPLPNSNQDRDNLCEIEVDDNGSVYVVNNGYTNGSDILWVYDSNGAVRKCGLQTFGIYGPVGLCCSSYDNSRLYLASSMVEPDATSASLYVLSTADLTLVQTITINNMGHITDIAEDPITGTLWVAGFTMPQYMTYLPADLSQMPQFYHPYLAAVPYGGSGPVQAEHLSDAADLALPLSIAWVGPTPDKCGGADLDGLGDVSFGDLKILTSQWLQPPGTPSADIAPVPGDGIVNFLDLAVLAAHWLITCGP